MDDARGAPELAEFGQDQNFSLFCRPGPSPAIGSVDCGGSAARMWNGGWSRIDTRRGANMLSRVYLAGHPDEGAHSTVVEIDTGDPQQVALSHTLKEGFGEKCVIEDLDELHQRVRLLPGRLTAKLDHHNNSPRANPRARV